MVYSFRLDLDNAVVGLHAAASSALDAVWFAKKSENWQYFHEILGLANHLKALEANKLPSPSLVNMQGPEALNSIVSRLSDRLTRGLSSLGTPNGKLGEVKPLLEAFPLILLLTLALLEGKGDEGPAAKGTQRRAFKRHQPCTSNLPPRTYNRQVARTWQDSWLRKAREPEGRNN